MDRLWDEMDDFIWHQDQPPASTSAYAQWNVIRLVKQNRIKVLLDGQGADEVMAGYHYFLLKFLASVGRQCSWTEAVKHIAALRPYRSLVCCETKPPRLRLRRRSPGRRSIGDEQYRLTSVVKPEFRVPNPDPTPHSFQDHLRWAISAGLQQLLRYEERNSMAFSVEARTPFLDYRLVELFLNMCGAYKIRDGWTKPFLREALEGSVPDDVRLRVDKKGFVTPELAWYLKHFDRIRKVLLSPDSPIHAWLDPAELDKWLDKKRFATTRDFSLFRVLAVHFWMLRFGLNETGPSSDPSEVVVVARTAPTNLGNDRHFVPLRGCLPLSDTDRVSTYCLGFLLGGLGAAEVNRAGQCRIRIHGCLCCFLPHRHS